MKNLLPKTQQSSMVVTLAVVFGLLVACSNSSNNGNPVIPGGPEDKIVLLELLPSSTRGFFQASSELAASTGVWSQMLEGTAAPWRHSPVDIVRYYSGPTDAARNADELILAQTTIAGNEYVLLADIDGSAGDTLLDGVQTENGGEYEGFALLITTDNGLYVVRLNARVWAFGPKSNLEQLIDVYLGAEPGIDQSNIAGHLDSLDDTRSLNIIYGLPGLYGDVPVPGRGDASLNPASIVTAALDVESGILDGSMQFVSPNADGYTQRLLGLLPEASPDIITVAEDTISIDLTGMSVSEDMLPLFKSLYIGMNAVDYAEAVIQGGNPPWLNFEVGENPNSVFINFEFLDQASRDSFEDEHLPEGFKLSPLRILETDKPRYFLVLNIYQSSGSLVQGARAEWSVFVHDPQTGEPRFLVVQAAAANVTADPVNGLVPPEPVLHEVELGSLTSFVGVTDEATQMVDVYFSSVIQWPQPPETYVNFAREFVVTNDYIFWGNAVADRGLYNASVHNRSAARIPDGEVTLLDNSDWSRYIGAEPVHTVVYLNPLDIVVSPWWNLDEDYLDVTEDYRQYLIDFKNGFYPPMMLGIAEAAMLGEGHALSATRTGESIVTTTYNFVINDPQALLASVGAQGVFTPVAISLDGFAEPDMYLTLEVSQREGDPCGLRADWSMYVLNEQSRMQTLQLDTFNSDACLDPVSLLGLPALVQQSADQDTVTTRIDSPFVRFSATLDLNNSTDFLPGQDWIEASDQLCSLNKVCDFSYYDGATLIQPVQQIDFSGITIDEISTPWNAFVNIEPIQVTVRQFPAIRAANPWRTVPVFGT